jgi:two-component system response regulator HupR/HoxA
VVHDYRQRLEEQQALALLFSEYGLVGPSTDMQEVFRRALKASHFRDLPAVIVGGSGTPRGRLAVAIHNFDPQRNRRPFFSLDCTDLAKVLVDSAKREPDRASRTALSGWCGLFRAADGGTLFLDRVSELAPELQTALLGWSRSGRPAPDAADVVRGVRILAGDERPLDEAAAAGRLLPALATWLGLFRIELPALRGHPEDVAAQARRALRTYQTGRERVVLDFHPEALALLQRLLWAGNTRQLERTVRDALAHKERGTLLRLAELPAWVHEAPRDLPPARDGSDDAPARAEVPYQEWKLEEFERRLLRSVAGRFLSDSSPARERQPPR